MTNRRYIRINDVIIKEADIVGIAISEKSVVIETATRQYAFHQWAPEMKNPQAPNVLSLENFDKLKDMLERSADVTRLV